MPSSTYRVSVSSHVPVTVLLTLPLSDSTANSGTLPASCSQISVRVMHPPRVTPSADSRYSRSDEEEYLSTAVALASHSGFGIASFGEGVSAAPTGCCEEARKRLMIAVITAAARSIPAAAAVIMMSCAKCVDRRCFPPGWLCGESQSTPASALDAALRDDESEWVGQQKPLASCSWKADPGSLLSRDLCPCVTWVVGGVGGGMPIYCVNWVKILKYLWYYSIYVLVYIQAVLVPSIESKVKHICCYSYCAVNETQTRRRV